MSALADRFKDAQPWEGLTPSEREARLKAARERVHGLRGRYEAAKACRDDQKLPGFTRQQWRKRAHSLGYELSQAEQELQRLEVGAEQLQMSFL